MLELEIVNLNEVVKFMSPLVNIDHFPFANTWFKDKVNNIQEAKKYVEENFSEKYHFMFPEEDMSLIQIKKECKILKIYDEEYGQDDSGLFYEFEISDTQNNTTVATYCEKAGYGTVHCSLIVEKNEKSVQ